MKLSCRALHTGVPHPSASRNHPTPYSWISDSPAGPSNGPLAGRRIAIKDNISYIRAPASCSSLMLQDYYPPYTATCVNNLIDAGADIVGQTKMDEFGMGSQTTHLPPYYTPVHNPASPHPDEAPRTAGGSSGGSAAAVAEGSCWAALGTDTGGSVRLPASYCGVVGLKPSFGMISRHGVVSYVDSLDCVGVLSTSVDNVQQVFDVLSHPNENDMSCATRFTQARSSSILQNNLHHYSTFPSLPLTGLRIGLPVQDRLPAPNVQTPPRLLKHLESLGATLHPGDIPTIHVALPAYYVLASAEASSNLARYGGGWFGSPKEREQNKEGESGEERRRRSRTEGFGREVKKRLLAGTYALSADAFNNTYLKALHLRRLLRQQMSSLFRIPNPLNPNLSSASEGVDILLHPTAIRTAPRHDEAKEANGESEYLQDYLTVPASLAGLPAMSVPAGRGADGWPVGVSLVSQWGMENILFWAGRGIESWSTEA